MSLNALMESFLLLKICTWAALICVEVANVVGKENELMVYFEIKRILLILSYILSKLTAPASDLIGQIVTYQKNKL